MSAANDERDLLERKRDRCRDDQRHKRAAVDVAEKDKTDANEKLLTARAEAAKRTAAENMLKSLQSEEKQSLKEISDRRKEVRTVTHSDLKKKTCNAGLIQLCELTL